ncbi:TBC1 domain family member 2A isoform X2 [Syngnathoides biaculeatus]|uniref:TBC1 domain family member 2A isoform X2 n=1 Tax=Syngnathoides biaculeatus TaxID=300417 RepID=UPI002ADE210F|nr:TBC1 domain family member 2A isoform X2 [Syngnathoides biaculeatus]
MNQDKDHQSHQKATTRLTSITPLAPLPAHLDLHQTVNSADLDPHQAQSPTPTALHPQLPAHLDSYQDTLHADLERHQTASSAHLDSHHSPLHGHLDLQQTPNPPHPDPQLPADRDSHQSPFPAERELHQTTTSVPLDPHQAPDSAHLNPQFPAHLNSDQPHLPAHLEPPPTSTPAIETHQAPPAHPDRPQAASVHMDPQLHVSLKSHRVPRPAHLDIHQAPPRAPPDPYKPLPSVHMDPQVPAHPDPDQNSHQMCVSAQLERHRSPSAARQAPSVALPDSPRTRSSVHSDTNQTPPSPYTDPRQTCTSAHLVPQHPAQLLSHRTSLPAHPDPHQTSLPVHLDHCEAPSLAGLDSHDTPLSVQFEGQDAGNFSGSSGEAKLCGFLQKQGGPLRAWKRRWFTYEEKQNQMYYYRTPQDVTPLGRVDLTSATFSYPLKAEMGTFHIETPERIYTLKAVTQDLMLYWLHQLQLKRWHHRQNQKTSSCPEAADIGDDFLPLLKSPAGLVGEEAADESPHGTALGDVSIKHPFIQIQNTVHSLRKRSSQDWAQSVFYVRAPAGVGVDADADDPASVTAPPTVPVGRALVRAASCALPNTRRRKKDFSSSESVSRLQRDKEMLMEEVKAQKELVWLLHKTLEATQLERPAGVDFVAAEGERERPELLRHPLGRSEQVAGNHLDRKDPRVAQLRERVRELTEKNHAKQEVILKLSDHVAAFPPTSASSVPDTIRQLQQRVEDLKDDIEAYKTQNKFLNSEILQLTKLWRKSSEQERSLMVKCAYLEAWCCQAESRYLGVLRKLQENRSLAPDQQRTIQKIVEDALEGQTKNVNATTRILHDEYGFKFFPDYEVEDVKLLAKIQALEIRSHNLLQQEDRERPLLSRWAQYLAGRSDEDFCHSPELKGLLRAGVPQEYRQSVWRSLVRSRTRTVRERHPQRYQQLCDKSRTCPHPASRQIQLDLHRTLTSNLHFSSPSSPAHQQLQRILLAFSWQNPSVGYCQGLNRLAAIALLVLQSEEEAFWCVVAVVDAIMPQDYYSKNLLAAQADQYVLKDFLVEKVPRLAAHFDLYGVDVSLVTLNWFLVVFVESLPSDILLPVWDAFLHEGTKVMFRYALALFKYKEDDILKIRDGADIHQYLRFFTKTITDTRSCALWWPFSSAW